MKENLDRLFSLQRFTSGILLLVPLLLFFQAVSAKNLFLVSAIIGDGAQVRGAEGSRNLELATYLPMGERITIRPRSGLESLASSRTLRFGSGTSFTSEPEHLVIHDGSLLYRTRKTGNFLRVVGPEVDVSLDGMGTILLEVEPNGGFKLVGLLGRLRVTDKIGERATQLLPGELLFVKPGGRGFGDKVFVNLEKLVESSFLVGGFENLSSFERSLTSVTKAQGESIAKRYRAKVGSARGIDTFEVIPIESSSEEAAKLDSSASENSSAVPESPVPSRAGPLEEFLGRPAKRIPEPAKPTHVDPVPVLANPVVPVPKPAPTPVLVSPSSPAGDPLDELLRKPRKQPLGLFDASRSRKNVNSANDPRSQVGDSLKGQDRIVFEDDQGRSQTELIFRSGDEKAQPNKAVPDKPVEKRRLPGRLFELP